MGYCVHRKYETQFVLCFKMFLFFFIINFAFNQKQLSHEHNRGGVKSISGWWHHSKIASNQFLDNNVKPIPMTLNWANISFGDLKKHSVTGNWKKKHFFYLIYNRYISIFLTCQSIFCEIILVASPHLNWYYYVFSLKKKYFFNRKKKLSPKPFNLFFLRNSCLIFYWNNRHSSEIYLNS